MVKEGGTLASGSASHSHDANSCHICGCCVNQLTNIHNLCKRTAHDLYQCRQSSFNLEGPPNRPPRGRYSPRSRHSPHRHRSPRRPYSPRPLSPASARFNNWVDEKKGRQPPPQESRGDHRRDARDAPSTSSYRASASTSRYHRYEASYTHSKPATYNWKDASDKR